MMHHYEEHKTVKAAQEGGKQGRSATAPYQDTPYYLRVEAKGGVLWLSRKECIEILKRGKRWRKVMAQWNPKRSPPCERI